MPRCGCTAGAVGAVGKALAPRLPHPSLPRAGAGHAFPAVHPGGWRHHLSAPNRYAFHVIMQRLRPAPFVRPLALALVGALGLSACSLVPKPEPDPALTALYQRAAADATAAADAADPDTEALRSGDAQELKGEIERLCGHYDDGSVPSSCDVTATDAGSVDTSTPATTQILDTIAQVPQESLPVVVPEFVDLAARGATLPALHSADLSTATNSTMKKEELSQDVEALTEQLKQEYALIYGLGVALAFADSDLQQRVTDAIAQHREIASVLEASFPAGTTAPAPEAGYSLDQYTVPADAATAAQFVDEALADRAESWAATASTAHAESWRYQSLIIAGIVAQEQAG